MKILIVGSDINSLLLAKYLKIQSNEHDIFLTTEENKEPDIYTGINIKENNIKALVDFVKYNAIEFTIALSSVAIINGIADEFRNEGFLIFAPFVESARLTFFSSIAKKVIYKLKINTPRFGIFDRENIAIDYIRKLKFPIVIQNDFTALYRDRRKYNSFSKAKEKIQEIFENNNERIVIENYVDEDELFAYFITDGYNALPLVGLEKKKTDKYETITAQSKKFSDNLYAKLLKFVIYPLLDDISKYTDKYVGILGLKLKLIKDSFVILEIYNNFQGYDFQAFLSLLDEDLFRIIYVTTNNCLIENYDCIHQHNNYSYTITLKNTKLKNVDEIDDSFISCKDGDKYIITSSGITTNRAKEKLFDYLETILDKDLFDDIIKQEIDEELLI